VTKNTKYSKHTKEQIKILILDTAKKEKPETSKQLITIIQERYAVSPEQTANLIIELENEDRLYFTRHEPPSPISAKGIIFSKQSAWYWTTIALAMTTTIAVFTISDTAYPMVYLRSAFAIIFVLFLPGFAFIKVLFPAKVPDKTSSKNIDTIERVALSIGMSLVLVPMVGFILNYTPWRITLTPITLSLLGLTVVFATAAILREHQIKPNPV